MGEVVFLAAYRREHASEPPPAVARDAGPSGVRLACCDFLTGLDRMRAAVRILSDASAELRELARDE